MKRKKIFGNNPKFKFNKSLDHASTSHGSQGNRFQLLENVADMDTLSESEDEISVPKDRLPPIVIDESTSFSTVRNILGSQYKFQRMSIGTKVISESISLYEEALRILQHTGSKFYTHQLKDQKKFKLVLFGLPQLNSQTIIDEFKHTHNIDLSNIKEIKTKRTSIDDAIYMIEFNRDHISKREIRKIRFFCNIAVKWRNPLKGNKGPTQCGKCSMFGHGTSNCFRSPVCPACAGNHDFSVCNLSKTQHEGPVIYKCFNCVKRNYKNVNHKADDVRCPCRQDYLNIRSKITSNPAPIQNKQRNIQNVYNLHGDFPNLPSSSNSPPHAQPAVRNKLLYSELPYNNTQTDNSDDISNDKLLEIYFEAIDALQKCKNKFDKLRVLGNMLRYAI